MRSYRNKKTGKVRQEAHYIGKEVERDGEKIIVPPVDRTSVRHVLQSGPYILYHEVLENGFLANYDDALLGITSIRDAEKKIIMLAAETIAGPDHSIHIHTNIPELKDKEIRDVVDLVGKKDQDVASSKRDMDYFDEKKHRIGIFAIISYLDRNPSEIYEQYKSREGVEQVLTL